MKNYIGTKFIKAEEMNYGDFNLKKYGKIHEDENALCKETKGYLVEYEDGYISWSPKAVFEEAYKYDCNLSFGQAIELMKKGYKVAREGWNGKGMFIALSPGCKDLPSERFWCEHNKKFAEQNGGKADVLPYITMKTADNKILSGWLASQSDMLSNDWVIVLSNDWVIVE